MAFHEPSPFSDAVSRGTIAMLKTTWGDVWSRLATLSHGTPRSILYAEARSIMGKVSISKIQPGFVLADMHYGMPKDGDFPIVEAHRLTNVVRIEAPNGSSFIEEAVRQWTGSSNHYRYTNKLLVVVELTYPGLHNQVIKAAWAYDSFLFGLAEIEVNMKSGAGGFP